jgi:hypothetical protein
MRFCNLVTTDSLTTAFPRPNLGLPVWRDHPQAGVVQRETGGNIRRIRYTPASWKAMLKRPSEEKQRRNRSLSLRRNCRRRHQSIACGSARARLGDTSDHHADQRQPRHFDHDGRGVQQRDRRDRESDGRRGKTSRFQSRGRLLDKGGGSGSARSVCQKER